MWRFVVMFLGIVLAGTVWLVNHLDPDNKEQLIGELNAANAVREAVAEYEKGERAKTEPLDRSSVIRLVDQLAAAKVGNPKALLYVKANPSRFAIQGKTIDALWVVDPVAF